LNQFDLRASLFLNLLNKANSKTIYSWNLDAMRSIWKKSEYETKRRKVAAFLFPLILFLFLAPLFAFAVDRDALMNEARQKSWQGNYQEAVAIYQQLTENNSEDIEAWLGLARVFSWQKKYPESQTIYKKVREIRPDLPDGEIGLLRLKAWQGNHEEAEEGLKALYSQYPRRFDILFLLGQVTAWQRKFQASIDHYKKLLELYPDNMEALQGLAKTYQWMRKTKEGIELYSKILEKDPSNLEATLGIGILYSYEAKHAEAITYLEKARDLAPDRQDIRAMLGVLYSWTARLDDAVTELQKSLALERGDISSFITLGRVYSWQKKKEESIKLYKQALEIDPDNSEALVGLGRTYFFNDQWDLAEVNYRKALKAQPNDVEAMNALEKLRLAKAPHLVTRFEYFEFRDHDSDSGLLSSILSDFRETVEYLPKLNAKTTFQIRYQRVDQKQVDKINKVTDFNIDANIGSIGLTQKLPQDFGLRFRYDYNRFNNDGNNIFNLKDSETEHSGFFVLSKEYGRHYLTTSFARELFISTSNGIAGVEAINTYAISYDYDLTDHFSILIVPSLDDFSTDTGLRQDHIIRPRYRLPFYDKIQLEYQFRYLSKPDTYVNSFFVNFQNQLNQNFRYEADYAISYDSLDDSLEHLTTLFLAWNITDSVSWNVDAKFSIETLEDKDITQTYQTYLKLRF